MIPGGKKRRVREFLRDLDQYKHKLTQEQWDWLMDKYVDIYLNNNARRIEDIDKRNEQEKENESYRHDVWNRYYRLGNLEETGEGDTLPDRDLFRVVKKKEGKRRYRTMFDRDYRPASISPEDVLIEWIDAKDYEENADEEE